MSAGVWFWIFYIVALVFGGGYGVWAGTDRRWLGGGLVLFLLVGLLGWGVFGPPLR